MRAIVTGAGSGIGRATSFRLASDSVKRGASPQLLLVDLDPARLELVASELRRQGVQVEAMAADLADPVVPERILDRARTCLGGVDALISNAGIIQRGTLLELSLDQFDQCFAVNTRATWLLAKAAHPLLKSSRGCIVATASISAHHVTPPLGAYSASKAALVSLIKQMACDWGPDGIRCNTVSPGSTHTGMTDARYSDPAQRAAAEQRNPLRMIGSPEDQAAAIAFLAGPDAAYITGADIVVDGGISTMLMTASALGDPWRKNN